jgi:hypothetical protein
MILFSYDKENDGCGNGRRPDPTTERLFRFPRTASLWTPFSSSNSSNNGDENDVDEECSHIPPGESEPASTIATTSLTWTWTLILAGPSFQRQR